jgi:hypothetical protein
MFVCLYDLISKLQNSYLLMWYSYLHKETEGNKQRRIVRFQVLTATSMKMTISVDRTSCSLVEVGLREISSSHRGEYEVQNCLLGSTAV